MKVVSTNIISPLGMTTSENIAAVLEGRSGLRHLGDYTASVFSENEKAKIMQEGCTFFESLAYRSAKEALEIIVLLEKNYGIKLKTAEDGKKIFTTIRSIAEYVENHRAK